MASLGDNARTVGLMFIVVAVTPLMVAIDVFDSVRHRLRRRTPHA